MENSKLKLSLNKIFHLLQTQSEICRTKVKDIGTLQKIPPRAKPCKEDKNTSEKFAPLTFVTQTIYQTDADFSDTPVELVEAKTSNN